MKTNNHGIDYGLGRTNIDTKTGIRYGVISQNDVLQAWSDASEPDYGPPFCPKCGRQADNPEDFGETFASGIPDEYELGHGCADYVCVHCRYIFDSSEAFGDEPICFLYSDDGYQCEQHGGDYDIFITRSPYYTNAAYCSPCAPGACHLASPTDTTGPRAFCLGHDWFEASVAPYPVYSVATGEIVPPPTQP